MKVIAMLLLAVVSNGCGGGSSPNDGGGGSGSPGGASGKGGAAGSTGAAGSSGTTTVSHCDIDNAGTRTCIEYAVGFTASPSAGCAVLQGTYSTGSCDLTGSSGGCQQTVPTIGTQTTYFYAPEVTTAAVMTQCTNDGNATYVAVP